MEFVVLAEGPALEMQAILAAILAAKVTAI